MKKSNVLVIILSILVVVMGSYLIYDKVIVSNDNDTKVNEESKEETDNIINDSASTDDNKNSESNESLCSGTYYGKANGTLKNGLSYDYEYKYILNSDNTYSATFFSEEYQVQESGTYQISGGKIGFMYIPDVGPNPFSVASYDISDDCSYIVIDKEIDFKLSRQ